MRFIITAFILSTALFGSADWMSNYHDALKVAQDKNKRVYMLIVSDDCGWCKKFERTTLKNKKIIKRLQEKYVLLHLSRDSNYIPKKFKTTPVPRHYFLTSKGKEVFPVVGYRDVETFNGFLDDVEKRYQRLP